MDLPSGEIAGLRDCKPRQLRGSSVCQAHLEDGRCIGFPGGINQHLAIRGDVRILIKVGAIRQLFRFTGGAIQLPEVTVVAVGGAGRGEDDAMAARYCRTRTCPPLLNSPASLKAHLVYG